MKLVQHCKGTLYTQCCPNTSERTLHKKITGAMLGQTTQSSFQRKITICNVVVLICLSQHYTRKLPIQCWHIFHKQLCTKKNLQHCLDLSGPTLHKEITYVNVGQWLTDNFYEENNLYNVVSTMLGQHCIGILSSQCCPNTSERALHKKITSASWPRAHRHVFAGK